MGNADDIVKYLCERLRWELPQRRNQTPTQKQPAMAASSHDNAVNFLKAPGANVNLKKRPSEDGTLGQLRRIQNPRRVGERWGKFSFFLKKIFS
jgi:hypothetical protein